jgi:hypothetical protein
MVLLRSRHSIRKRGLSRTLGRCLLGPYDLMRTYLDVRRNYRKPRATDAFDVAYGVETGKRVHPTDLALNSPNWINAVGYWPTPTKLGQEAIASLPIKHEQFTFIDIGSGKGEFSPELTCNYRREHSKLRKLQERVVPAQDQIQRCVCRLHFRACDVHQRCHGMILLTCCFFRISDPSLMLLFKTV